MRIQKPKQYNVCPDMLSRAIALLCTSPCHELSHAANYVLRVGVIPANREQIATWLPLHRVPCSIEKLPDGHTVVYLDGSCFYGSKNVQLDPSFPLNVVLVGNYVEDWTPCGGTIGRVNFFDCWDVERETCTAWDRYSYLHEKLQPLLLSPVCKVQWAGYRYAVETFVDTPFERNSKVPHAIDGVLCLGVNHAYVPVIALRVVLNSAVNMAPREATL